MPSLLELSGARPQKEPKFVPLFIDQEFTGLFTQRSVLHDPSDLATAKFYGGRPDVLWMGSNVELTNNLTLKRRPGLSAFSTVTYPTAPDTAFSFQLTDGTIQVIIDTESTGNLTLTSVGNSSGGVAIYTGTITGGAGNAFVGLSFQVSGFLSGNNNGTFVATASSGTSLTLANTNATAETDPAMVVSSGAIYVDNQNGTKTLLYAKSPGAGQAYFVAVAGILYIGDGVDVKKYTPLNINGTIWNWGGLAPTKQPNVTITESGSAAVAWAASTWFSTMGIIIDSNGNGQQLTSVNALGTNGTQIGTSGSGQPAWNQTPGGSTTDGSVTWENKGPIGTWAPNTSFGGVGSFGTVATPAVIYDSVSGAYFWNSRNSPTTSGSTKPPFTNNPTSNYFDGGCNWVCASAHLVANWTPSTAYGNPLTGGTGGFLVEPYNPPIVGQTSYAQMVTSGGTSASSYSAPNWSTVAGAQTGPDGNLLWTCLGSSTWAPTTAYSAWTAPNTHTFSCVVDTNTSTLQVCIQTGISGGSAPWHIWQAAHAYVTGTSNPIIDTNGNIQTVTVSGTSGGSHPAWATTRGATTTDNTVTWVCGGSAYGFQTTDGSAIWVCVGTSTNATWAANKMFYLPKAGFSPPTTSNPYGSADVIDTNSNIEFVLNSGLSGGSTPSWNATTTGYTTDNQILWYNNGPASTNSLSWTTGYVYAYSYKARSLTDFYSVAVNGVLPIPPGLTNPLPAPTGSETGLITTASPVFTITGGNAGAVNTISGIGSTDTQFDTIVIWRSADGGGASNMFELTEIPMPPPIGGVGQPWTFQDYLPDIPTTLYPGLNELIPAPINDSNDPPPSAFLPMVYNFQRIWGANGQSVIFSGGPDVATGNPNEAFNPSDELPFLAKVVRIVKNAQGLVTFLTDSIEFIAGGPSTASFFSVTVGPGIGLGSYNMLDVFAGEIFFFASDNEFRIMSPTLNITTAGFPLGDQFANLPSSGVSDTIWDSSKGYVAVYQNGIDNCIIIADGSTGWYRCNPKQVPGGASGVEPIWSPYANITNGCKMVQTIEISPGQKRLLVGGTGNNEQILKRDLTVYTDNGTPYDAYFVMGAIKLAHPGQIAVLKFLEFDFSGRSYQPAVSFLINEIAGTFTPFKSIPVFDPPSIYGTTIIPQSYSPNRYYFSSTASLARCRFIQIKVDFGTTANPDELYDMCIFGRILVET